MSEKGGLAGEAPGAGVGDGDADPRVLLHLGPKANIATGPISGGQVRLALVNGKLLSQHEDPQLCYPIEPREDDQIERLHDRHHEQILHVGSMEPGHP